MERRQKIYQLSINDAVFLLNQHRNPTEFPAFNTAQPLPDDALCVNAFWDPSRWSICFVIESASFAPVPDGEAIPFAFDEGHELVKLKRISFDEALEKRNAELEAENKKLTIQLAQSYGIPIPHPLSLN